MTPQIAHTKECNIIRSKTNFVLCCLVISDLKDCIRHLCARKRTHTWPMRGPSMPLRLAGTKRGLHRGLARRRSVTSNEPSYRIRLRRHTAAPYLRGQTLADAKWVRNPSTKFPKECPIGSNIIQQRPKRLPGMVPGGSWGPLGRPLGSLGAPGVDFERHGDHFWMPKWTQKRKG